jgi:2-C-methyl-D-erythritol 4-phosphate cytidylyltransferase
VKGDSAAILVAGGQGKRFAAAQGLPAGRQVRKQYLRLSGRPILWWSLQAFQRSPSIGAIVLVVPQDDLLRTRKQFEKTAFQKLMQIVAGGATRAESVREGLAVVPPGLRWIAVHDAVRPLVTPQLIENVLKGARSYKAAIAATPSKDTVKLANGHQTIHKTLPRETVWLAQTPQAFDRDLLERAHKKGKHLTATDDSFLVERLGVRVKLIASPPENLKVTIPADLIIAQRLMKGRT